MTGAEMLLLSLACLLAGGVGATLGLGGGVFIVPLLTIWLGVPVHEAAGTSLVCVLATSAAGSVALDRTRLADPRLVAYLGVATVAGGAASAVVAPAVSPRLVFGLFGLATGWAAWRLVARLRAPAAAAQMGPAPPAEGPANLGVGVGACVGAGVASGLLGIGGAPVQVPVMTEVMRVAAPVAFATSNVLVGITAAASTAAYYGNGLIRADLAAPCALASAIGAYAGGRLAPRLPVRPLVTFFVVVLVYLTGRMLWKAIAPGA
ncbi:MAG: sulfite exporter TauE/SafE family protein [Planctomycetes bacterium]|nr:sulfite exporter TauE/SafE family protein [Planctomycetota bacterium]